MRQSFRHLGPDRIQIRQGGGVLAIFGLPFFAAGVFMLLTIFGVIKMSNADSVSLPGQLGLLFMGLVFTAVGGALSFGRGWTTIDSTRREVIKQYGLMVPMYTDRATHRRIQSPSSLDSSAATQTARTRFPSP